MNPRSKITTVAMAIALASGVGFLHAQSGGQGGSSGSVGARDRTNDPLSNNNGQNDPLPSAQAPASTPAVDPMTGQPMDPNRQNSQPSTGSENNGNNMTTDTRQDANVRTPTDPMPRDNASPMSTDNTSAGTPATDSTLPARADRN
ncbi:hypothetical protein CDN99_01595 [Roseateles aquatilis]|uniref:Uncharacterized protein n=1 Tax=Roseateles aquatilis TaxID=431061 RepID=A0A246JKV2_9BURK|nr:hypothetical protein [Roseateles aquatilis]OWQ93215.1 hypothetical protein CDN99_01595 [Roseateles aquatilis]